MLLFWSREMATNLLGSFCLYRDAYQWHYSIQNWSIIISMDYMEIHIIISLSHTDQVPKLLQTNPNFLLSTDTHTALSLSLSVYTAVPSSKLPWNSSVSKQFVFNETQSTILIWVGAGRLADQHCILLAWWSQVLRARQGDGCPLAPR